MVRCGLLLIPVLFVAVQGYGGQQPSDANSRILLGGFELQLGMDQEQTLRKLNSVYEIKHQENMPGNWMVLKRGGPPFDIMGIVSFRRERLVFASKSWGPSADDQTASALALALHDA